MRLGAASRERVAHMRTTPTSGGGGGGGSPPRPPRRPPGGGGGGGGAGGGGEFTDFRPDGSRAESGTGDVLLCSAVFTAGWLLAQTMQPLYRAESTLQLRDL